MIHKLKDPPPKGLREQLDKGKGLSRRERRELVELLRRNLMYQTPRPVFASPDEDEPKWVQVRMLTHQHQRVLWLLDKAGGWTLSHEERTGLLDKYDKACRRAYGDGTNYNFSGLEFGDLVAMHSEMEGVAELADFREAIEDALKEASDDDRAYSDADT